MSDLAADCQATTMTAKDVLAGPHSMTGSPCMSSYFIYGALCVSSPSW